MNKYQNRLKSLCLTILRKNCHLVRKMSTFLIFNVEMWITYVDFL